MKKLNTWLFISRLQPAHSGHLSALNQAISQWVNDIILWIGSADKEMTHNNPFSFDQRKWFATALASELAKNHPEINVSVHPIIDFWNNEQRKNYISSSLPSFDTIITWNPIIKEVIWIDKKIIVPNHTDMPYRGTHIRHQIMNENRATIKQSVPQLVIDHLLAIDAPRIMKTINKLQPQQPKLATDIITMYEWNFVLIKRTYAPHWLSLAWWMLDPWERLRECAKREGEEELFQENDALKNIKITSQQPLRINDDPERDPRWRVISFVYQWIIQWWTLSASSDADAIAWIQLINPNNIESIPDEDFAFLDHKKSLLRYRDMYL